jgi:leader peptidase (prepilin peptidase) / N-methyltransferase
MMVAAVVVAAVLGALVGSVLTVLAWRLPRAIPLRAGPGADGALVADLWADVPVLSRHPRETETLYHTPVVAVRPPVLEAVTGTLFALMVLRFGVSWALPAYLTLAASAVLLGVVDLQHRRLPNTIVGPFAVAGLVALTLAAVGSGAWESLVRAFLGAVLLFFLYLVLALISPASLGMGDVKLAGVLGLYLAYVSWRTVAYGAVGAFIIAALTGVVLLVTGRVNRRTQLPFGPSMLLAALVAVVVHGP